MRTVLIYSGGMDSTVLLYSLLDLGREVKALGVLYGQRHKRELQAARLICEKLRVEYRIADLSGLRQFLGGSSQTDDLVPVPHGHYAEDNMRVTVVPNRNALMLSVAAAWAISLKYDSVAYAAHAGDHAQYPDCRPQFIAAMRTLLCFVGWDPLLLEAPFSHRTKAEIAKVGYHLNVPFAETWSCYEGGDLHCGLCGTCVERREAFFLAGVTDPTPYRASWKETQELLAKK
jgi:7-cyano-7-deazaguanine synthase